MNRHSILGSILALAACVAFVLVPGTARAAGAKAAKKAPAAKMAKKDPPKAMKKAPKKAMKKHAAMMKRKVHEYRYTGEVLDLDCYLEHGAHGAKHATCAVGCMKDGAPAGLLLGHRAYLLIGDKPNIAAYQTVRGMAAKRVTVIGHKLWRHGIPAIVVESVKTKS